MPGGTWGDQFSNNLENVPKMGMTGLENSKHMSEIESDLIRFSRCLLQHIKLSAVSLQQDLFNRPVNRR